MQHAYYHYKRCNFWSYNKNLFDREPQSNKRHWISKRIHFLSLYLYILRVGPACYMHNISYTAPEKKSFKSRCIKEPHSFSTPYLQHEHYRKNRLCLCKSEMLRHACPTIGRDAECKLSHWKKQETSPS